MSEMPAVIRARTRLSVVEPGCLRFTRMCPVRARCQPQIGKRPSESFAMMRSWCGTFANTMGMS